MVLQLVHRCHLRKHNDGAMGGNVQIKGRNILIRSPYLVTEGEKSDTLIFFIAEKDLPKQILGCPFSCFLGW